MFVYILYSHKVRQFYTGQARDTNLRIIQHNSGNVKSTKKGVPWRIVYTTEVANRTEALEIEKKIKGRGAKRYLENINFDFSIL